MFRNLNGDFAFFLSFIFYMFFNFNVIKTKHTMLEENIPTKKNACLEKIGGRKRNGGQKNSVCGYRVSDIL